MVMMESHCVWVELQVVEECKCKDQEGDGKEIPCRAQKLS